MVEMCEKRLGCRGQNLQFGDKAKFLLENCL